MTADLYRYNEETNTITFYKEWFDMMEKDDDVQDIFHNWEE